LKNAEATGFLETLYYNFPKEYKESFHSILGEKARDHIDRLATFYGYQQIAVVHSLNLYLCKLLELRVCIYF